MFKVGGTGRSCEILTVSCRGFDSSFSSTNSSYCTVHSPPFRTLRIRTPNQDPRNPSSTPFSSTLIPSLSHMTDSVRLSISVSVSFGYVLTLAKPSLCVLQLCSYPSKTLDSFSPLLLLSCELLCWICEFSFALTSSLPSVLELPTQRKLINFLFLANACPCNMDGMLNTWPQVAENSCKQAPFNLLRTSLSLPHWLQVSNSVRRWPPKIQSNGGELPCSIPPKKQFSKTLSKSEGSTTSTLTETWKIGMTEQRRLSSLPSQNLHKNTHTHTHTHTHNQSFNSSSISPSVMHRDDHYHYRYDCCSHCHNYFPHSSKKENYGWIQFLCFRIQTTPVQESRLLTPPPEIHKQKRRSRRSRPTTTTTTTTERDLEKRKTAPTLNGTRSRKSERRRRQKAQSQTGRRRKNTTKKTTTKERRRRPPRRKNDEKDHHDETSCFFRLINE